MKLMQTNKGEFGYLKRERKRRIIIAAIMLGVPVFIFISMWIYQVPEILSGLSLLW